jgi:hypothetical protein
MGKHSNIVARCWNRSTFGRLRVVVVVVPIRVVAAGCDVSVAAVAAALA